MSDLKFNEEGFTKEQAKFSLNHDLTAADFWRFDDDQDNISILQSVLDVLFNKESNSRIYVGDYCHSQNGVRLVVKCKVCNIELSSYDPFMGHDNGKKHKKIVQQSFAKDFANPNMSGPIVLRPTGSPLNIFDVGSLEDKLDHTNHVVLGFQFLFHQIFEDKDYYSCDLCHSMRMEMDIAFNHIISDDHILKFLNIKYGLKFKSYADAYEEIRKISEMEGKVTTSILTTGYTEFERKQFEKEKKEKLALKGPSEKKLSTSQKLQADNLTGSSESFMKELQRLRETIGDCEMLIKFLKADRDAYEILILLIQVVTEKLHGYSKTIDSSLENITQNLMEKTSLVKIPPVFNDYDLD